MKLDVGCAAADSFLRVESQTRMMVRLGPTDMDDIDVRSVIYTIGIAPYGVLHIRDIQASRTGFSNSIEAKALDIILKDHLCHIV